MVKNSCNCKNDNFSPGIGSFYLFRRYNSSLIKRYENNVPTDHIQRSF